MTVTTTASVQRTEYKVLTTVRIETAGLKGDCRHTGGAHTYMEASIQI